MSKDKGLIDKFTVIRNDGKSAPGEKHEDCSYFVLDLTHDKHAIPAIQAYAESCKEDYPILSGELICAADILENDQNPETAEELPEYNNPPVSSAEWWRENLRSYMATAFGALGHPGPKKLANDVIKNLELAASLNAEEAATALRANGMLTKFECPHCHYDNDGFLSDPRGTSTECDNCENVFDIPSHTPIVIE